MRGGVHDSGLHCLFCSSSPTLEIKVERNGSMRGTCPLCFKHYDLDKEVGGFSVNIFIPRENLVGTTGMSLLSQLSNMTSISDKKVDRETRKKLRKLESVGLVKCDTYKEKKKKKHHWRISVKGMEFLEAHAHEGARRGGVS